MVWWVIFSNITKLSLVEHTFRSSTKMMNLSPRFIVLMNSVLVELQRLGNF